MSLHEAHGYLRALSLVRESVPSFSGYPNEENNLEEYRALHDYKAVSESSPADDAGAVQRPRGGITVR